MVCQCCKARCGSPTLGQVCFFGGSIVTLWVLIDSLPTLNMPEDFSKKPNTAGGSYRKVVVWCMLLLGKAGDEELSRCASSDT